MGEDKGQYRTVLLLGNGFDLHYKLLTKYEDFLLTVAFLAKQEDLSKFNTYADLLGCAELRDRNDRTRANWQQYEKTYKSLDLPLDKIQELAAKAKGNVWFKYLLESFNKDVGWIDFEKEIAYVISCFKSFFPKVVLANHAPHGYELDLQSAFEDNGSRYIISTSFNFFLHSPFRNTYCVKEEYLLDYPTGSTILVLNKGRVVKHLYDSLRELATMLGIYLFLFADNVFYWSLNGTDRGQITEEGLLWEIITEDALLAAVSFNYTHTFDGISNSWPNYGIVHIHGTADNLGIVLGINPDKDDLIDTVNTDFIRFKKYFQRVFYDTDLPYLKAVDGLRSYKADPNNLLGLIVMGHSLDVTDRDIIEELMGLADRVTILYHSEKSVASYISNLVAIFGKEGFDTIRTKKRLKFQSISEAQALAYREFKTGVCTTG